MRGAAGIATTCRLPPPPPPAPPPPPPPPPASGGGSSGGTTCEPALAALERPLIDKLHSAGLPTEQQIHFALISEDELAGAGLSRVERFAVARQQESVLRALLSPSARTAAALDTTVVTPPAQSACHGATTFAWGSDVWGRLGHGTVDRHQALPTEVVALRGTALRAVACGAAHAIALTEDGRVYCWGKAHMHQVPVGGEEGPATGRLASAVASAAADSLVRRWIDKLGCWGVPRQVTSLQGAQIGAVAAGMHHCLALTAHGGRLYSWVRAHGLVYMCGSSHQRLSVVKRATWTLLRQALGAWLTSCRHESSGKRSRVRPGSS
eukprot:SAG25_NODE_1137_length_3822_cov_1.656460_3_plen_323_part_00